MAQPTNERRQAARQLAEQLLTEPSPIIAQALAQVCANLDDIHLRQGVLDALGKVTEARLLDLIWEVWEKTRSIYLENLLLEAGRCATYPLTLQILSSLKLGQTGELSKAGAEMVEPLLAAAMDTDTVIRTGALEVLSKLTQPEAQEEICRWVIEHDHPRARQAALQGGYAPRQAQRRALYYLLTEQWERYEALDFDASLLRAVHQAGDEILRSKLARLARQAGWTGYAQAIAGGHVQRQLSSLSVLEWEVILTILGRHRRFEEAWQLAQIAPPLWSARLLQDLHEAGWEPQEEDEQAIFASLRQAADDCMAQGAPLERLPGKPQLLKGHNRPIRALAFSPDGAWLASGGLDRSVCFWQVKDAVLQARLDGHSAAIIQLAFSPDGARLASGSVDRSIRLWLPDEGRCIHTLGGHAGEVSALAFSPSEGILSSGDSVTVRLWNAEQGRLLHLMPPQGMGVHSLAFNPDGKILASGHSDNALNLWSMPDGERMGLLKENVACWGFVPGSAADTGILATSSSYGSARLWQVSSGEILKSLEGRTDGEQLAISPDGRLLAASDRNLIRIWGLPGGEAWRVLEGHARRILYLAFSPDGRLLASGQDDRLRLWQMPDGNFIDACNLSAAPGCAVFSPCGNALAYAEEERLYLQPLHDLGRWFRLPVGQAGEQGAIQQILESNQPADSQTEIKAGNMNLLAKQSAYADLERRERSWLAFTLALYRWHGRFDIEIDQSTQRLVIGDFDIEISG